MVYSKRYLNKETNNGFCYKNKIIITGAGGIGKATAIELAVWS